MQAERPIWLVEDEVVLFAEECVLYMLRYHNIDWNPFIGNEDRRRFAEIRVFTPEIGHALVHACMIHRSKQVADLTHFNEEQWLGMDEEEWLKMNPCPTEVNIAECFDKFVSIQPHNEPGSYFYFWSFACYLCLKAAHRNKIKFIYYVLTKFVNMTFAVFNYLQFYEFLHLRAICYNLVHFEFHNENSENSDDGYRSDDE